MQAISARSAEKGQKAPSVHEHFAKARERYTILTTVTSWAQYEPADPSGDPPPVFVLFKGKKNGRICQDINRRANMPPWLRVQVQECGSYRETDMVDALREVLPPARSTAESIVVILDWFSAHRSERVIRPGSYRPLPRRGGNPFYTGK